MEFDCAKCGEKITIQFVKPGEECQCKSCGFRQKVLGEYHNSDFQLQLSADPVSPYPFDVKNYKSYPPRSYYTKGVISIVIIFVAMILLARFAIQLKNVLLGSLCLIQLSWGIGLITNIFCLSQLSKRHIPLVFKNGPFLRIQGAEYYRLALSRWQQVRRLAKENSICRKALLFQNAAIAVVIGVVASYIICAIVWLYLS